MNPEPVVFFTFLAWLALTVGSYAGIRYYIHRRGEPTGWRFNHHGANWFPGHLSFYPRDGNDIKKGVVFRSVTLFPLFWKVRTGHSRSDLETVRRGPVWSVIPWAFSYMANLAVLSISKDTRGDADGK